MSLRKILNSTIIAGLTTITLLSGCHYESPEKTSTGENFYTFWKKDSPMVTQAIINRLKETDMPNKNGALSYLTSLSDGRSLFVYMGPEDENKPISNDNSKLFIEIKPAKDDQIGFEIKEKHFTGFCDELTILMGLDDYYKLPVKYMNNRSEQVRVFDQCDQIKSETYRVMQGWQDTVFSSYQVRNAVQNPHDMKIGW